MTSVFLYGVYGVFVCAGARLAVWVYVLALNGPVGQDLAPYTSFSFYFYIRAKH